MSHPNAQRPTPNASSVLSELQAFVEQVEPSPALKPGHRIKFQWPPHPVSYKYHVLSTDWTGTAVFQIHGESFAVAIARTPYGVFGRIEDLWLEAKGKSEREMLTALREAAEPLFQRQFGIAQCLGNEDRFTGHIRDLNPFDLLRLLYCVDRDVASEAAAVIETHPNKKVFTDALISILRDDRHPARRSAQWCVLDLFEDLPAFVYSPESELAALEAIRDLIWSAPDDYARTTFKAGVVLGGHLPHMRGGKMLLTCVEAPSKFGRRAAIHGLFHTVEWVPELREEVITALRKAAEDDAEPSLREFAAGMAEDIEHGSYDHVPEPVFEGE